ncbi:MAG: SOS response-associated peptidase [Magnetococcales bacterium]|nr:SOS response-associated peptidase [Magnetococcales bacterium]
MCGRFAQLNGFSEVVMTAGARIPLGFLPRFNIAPSQVVSVIRRVGGGGDGLEVASLGWGLVPAWAESADIGGRLINARAETAAQKPSFRSAFKSRRCLIPTDGFYEWKRKGGRGGGGKQPYFIRMAFERPFAFGGLWESWKGEGDDGALVETFTVLTTEPNDVMRPIHNRMPLIIKPDDFALWLDGDQHDYEAINRLLIPYQANDMYATAVSSFVNSTRNEGPGCILPPEEDKQLSLF